MTTEAQINANRQNAQKSTGPKTLSGKARSALNALVHGFRSRLVFEHSSPEDADSFADFLAAVVAALRPVGPLESQCVETMALCDWRRRIVIRKELDFLNETDPGALMEELRYQWECRQGRPDLPPPSPATDLPHPEKLLPIVRYEAHLTREYRYAFRQLKDLQSLRLANPLPSSSTLPNEANPVHPAHPCETCPPNGGFRPPVPSASSVSSADSSPSLPNDPGPCYPFHPVSSSSLPSVPSLLSSPSVPNEANPSAPAAGNLVDAATSAPRPFPTSVSAGVSATFTPSNPFVPNEPNPVHPVHPCEFRPPVPTVFSVFSVFSVVSSPSPFALFAAFRGLRVPNVPSLPSVVSPAPPGPHPVHPVHPCEFVLVSLVR